MNKFDLNSFDQNINYVIEASAGTGKTYNIVEIVDKLVNLHHIDLHKILIVTYTEKAAGELKNRIRDKIVNADIDNAPIYTIHSFCQNTIKEFGLSANLPFNLNVIDESEIYKFADRYIREGDIVKDIALLYEAGEELKIDGIKEILVKGTQMYYLDINNNEDPSIISLDDVEYSRELFTIKVSILKKTAFNEFLNMVPQFKENYNILLESSIPKAQEFAKAIEESYFESFKFSGNKFTARTFQSDPLISKVFLYFKDIKEKLTDKTKAIKLDKLIGPLYLKDFFIKWQREKEINKSQTFDDMIRYVREAIIHNETLKNKLKEKYSRAIIDEFQDTNQKQFDIFKSIFMEDEDHKIIVVGDPKQSIYSFQGADINVYYDAVNSIIKIGGKKCMLNKNYRSTQGMVESCNKLFNYYDFSGTSFENCGYLSETDGENNYHEVLYNGEKTKAFWIATDGSEEGIDAEEFATIAVQQILDCCSIDKNDKTKLQIKPKEKQFRNVTFKDFAVLARTKAEMVAIEKALKNAGIPYLRYKDNQLFLGKECAHWISILKAINVIDFTGKNRNILKKALFSNFFGLSLKQINSDYVNKDDIPEVILINKWKKLKNANNWEELFDDIIISSRLSENMNSLKEIQPLAIYKQISNYCIEYLSNDKTFDDLIRSLSNLSKGGDYEGDDQNGTIVEKSTNFDCVQIMTIHASKGLQFPVVIAPCGFKKPNRNGKVFKCHIKCEDDKEKQVIIFERTEEVKNENIEEWKRLFYVAYTRPQFLLIMPYYNTYGDDFLRDSVEKFMVNNKDSYKIIYNNELGYEELRKQTSKILSKLGSSMDDLVLKEQQDKVLKQMIKETSNKKTYKHSYSSLSHQRIQLEEVEDIEVNKEGIIEEGLSVYDKNNKVIIPNYDDSIEPIVLPTDYPRGAKLGTALHEVFENLDFQNYEENISFKINRCFLNQGIKAKDEWISATKLIVDNVLKANLPIIRGNNLINESFNLTEISFENKLDELEFNFNVLSDKLKNYCNGFVDMIFTKDDYYSIVDWKSDRLNDLFDSYSNIDSLKNHVDDCYSIQRVLYSYCLIKWLKTTKPELSEQQIFEKHFGGIYYIFLRGCNENTGNGVYCQTWESWDVLEEAFKKIVADRIGGNYNE